MNRGRGNPLCSLIQCLVIVTDAQLIRRNTYITIVSLEVSLHL